LNRKWFDKITPELIEKYVFYKSDKYYKLKWNFLGICYQENIIGNPTNKII
jgi:hypothetical protein